MTVHGKSIQELVREAITDESLRRMARKNGVTASSQEKDDHVNNTLRRISPQVLYNLCEKMSICTNHREAKTLTPQNFRAAGDHSQIWLRSYAAPTNKDNTFKKCRTFFPEANEFRYNQFQFFMTHQITLKIPQMRFQIRKLVFEICFNRIQPPLFLNPLAMSNL